MAEHTPQADKNRLLQPARDEESAPPAGADQVHPLLRLGQQVGNAQVARMLAQREAAPEEELVQPSRDPALQREADDEELVQPSRDPALQREADDEELVQPSRDPLLQRSSAGEPLEVGLEGGPVSADTAARIQSKRGGGSPLSDGMRQTMESSLGSPLNDVRLHTDGESAKLNDRLGARAFTTGSDIFFGASGSPGDQGLLAHELTHVVQQRSMSGSGPMTVGADGDQYEQEANRVASQVASGPAAGDR
jgi:hypothetical protein